MCDEISVYDLFDGINERVEKFVHTLTPVTASELGLDSRAGRNLYVNEDVIVVAREDDQLLQYYGGFEYISKDARYVMGDYVFYMRDEDDSGRVDTCLETFETA
jgi:hypothetical protein